MNEVQSKLDQNDKKLKETNMQRLQLKVKEFINIERELRSKLKAA